MNGEGSTVRENQIVLISTFSSKNNAINVLQLHELQWRSQILMAQHTNTNKVH